MEFVNLIISLLSGAAGGNIAGAAFSEKNLGVLVNSIIGLVGGGAGDFLLKALGIISAVGATSATGETTGLDLPSILANIGTSGVSGAALTAIISLIKGALEKK